MPGEKTISERLRSDDYGWDALIPRSERDHLICEAAAALDIKDARIAELEKALKPPCETCGGKGYIDTPVWTGARYYSSSPATGRVKCWACETSAHPRPLVAAEARIAELEAAVELAQQFIGDEYADAEAQALEGEYVSRNARPVWNAVCAALARRTG